MYDGVPEDEGVIKRNGLLLEHVILERTKKKIYKRKARIEARKVKNE